MEIFKVKAAVLGVAIMAVVSTPVNAAIIISEVAPWSSSTSNPVSFGSDWFELTNTGSAAVNISGWKMDDNSNSFASSVALTGVTSIAAGQSVVFIENSSVVNASFSTRWFNSPSSGLVIGNYSGSGVGLSQSADAVNIYDASGVLQANVSFGASDTTVPLQTFDNAAGLNNTTISLLSTTGVNGAFVAANAAEIGSPGSISSVPVPAAVWLFGSVLMGLTRLVRKQKAA
jgi:hypothetical protein